MQARSHSTPSGRRPVASRTAALLSAAALALALPGCVGYSSYPNVEGAKLASTNPNLYSSRECMAISLAWVMNKFPPSTPATTFGSARAHINLVPGVTRDSYLKVADKVSASTNIEVSPVEPGADDSGLPIYHVARVWLRHGDAKVDVLRPMPELGLMADGQPVYQCITVILSGGFQPWLVKGTHTREPGLVETPPLYFLPDPEPTGPAPYPGDEGSTPAPDADPPAPGATEVVPENAGEGQGQTPPVNLPENPR